MSDSDPSTPLLVACLCAAWCGTCRDYRAVYDTLRAEFAGQTQFVWVDIEDDEDLLGSVEVDDFPTLLVAHGDQIRFFGPLLPHAQTARALLQRALRAELGVVADARLLGLPQRLRTLGG
jgi:thioredoxin 1